MISGMSSPLCSASEALPAPPTWFTDLLGCGSVSDGQHMMLAGQPYVCRAGIIRAERHDTTSQEQTQRAFSFIWEGEDRFQSEGSLQALRDWYLLNYGDIANAPWWSDYGDRPLVLEAGCGAGISGTETFGSRLQSVRYLGVDISTAIDRAARRFLARGLTGAAFLQTSLMDVPVPDGTVDVIFSQGVLHHTDDTRAAILALAPKLRAGGRFAFYVYRRKGPIREFTDDYVRAKLQAMDPEQAWEAMKPLTRLGNLLGSLDLEVDIPERIDLLDIPAGRINLQRLFYWHIFKAFHHPDMTFDELNHINLDWYAPINAHRQSPEEVRAWCDEAGFDIEHEHLQESGISIIARKRYKRDY